MARGQFTKHSTDCQAELLELLRQAGGAASMTELHHRGAWGIRTATIKALLRRGEIACDGPDIWKNTLRVVKSESEGVEMVNTEPRNESHEQLTAEIAMQAARLRSIALQILERLNFDTSMPEVQADADDLVAIMQRGGLHLATGRTRGNGG